MHDPFLEKLDVVLTILALSGGATAFMFGLRQWRIGQKYKQAEQLDKFIDLFESNEHLRLAQAVTDWTARTVVFRGAQLTFTNDEALLALRDHATMGENPNFGATQSTLRDAYDALLNFFLRLEVAISSGLIEALPTKLYFSYWLEHFLSFDKHLEDSIVLNGMEPKKAVANYVLLYGSPKSVERLRSHFDL